MRHLACDQAHAVVEYTLVEAFSAPPSPAPAEGSAKASTPQMASAPSPLACSLDPSSLQKANRGADWTVKDDGWVDAVGPSARVPLTQNTRTKSSTPSPSFPLPRAAQEKSSASSTQGTLGLNTPPSRSPSLAPYSPKTADVWMLVDEHEGPCRLWELAATGEPVQGAAAQPGGSFRGASEKEKQEKEASLVSAEESGQEKEAIWQEQEQEPPTGEAVCISVDVTAVDCTVAGGKAGRGSHVAEFQGLIQKHEPPKSKAGQESPAWAEAVETSMSRRGLVSGPCP